MKSTSPTSTPELKRQRRALWLLLLPFMLLDVAFSMTPSRRPPDSDLARPTTSPVEGWAPSAFHDTAPGGGALPLTLIAEVVADGIAGRTRSALRGT